MFLTTGEVALAGGVIGGVLSWIGIWIGVRANRNREHYQRIWERTAVLYEQVLVEATAWAAIRDKLMHTNRLSRETSTLDEDERYRMGIRLEMFGHPGVQDAFERYAAAHWRWAGCHQALEDAYDQNTAVEAGHRMVSEQIPTEEVNRKQALRKTANNMADEQEAELRRTIREAVERKPGPDGWFRRGRRAVARGIRVASRYMRSMPEERQRRRSIRDR